MEQKNKKTKEPDGKRLVAKRLLPAFVIFATAGIVVWAVMGESATPVDYRDAELIGRGITLFAQNCEACHGKKAVGENARFLKGGDKPDGGYWAPALNGTAHAWHHPPDALFQIIKDGSPARNSPMRGWGDRLSEPDIHALLAYMQSLWPNALRMRYEQAFSKK